MTKSFKWTGFVTPTNQTTETDITVYSGNFVLEIVLPNALKIDSFAKLKTRLYDFIKSHNGRLPEHIRCTDKQYMQYKELFTKSIISTSPLYDDYKFQGIPLLRYSHLSPLQ